MNKGKDSGLHQYCLGAGDEPGSAIRREEIRAAFAAFAAMQNNHMAALANGKGNDIMEWRAERERVFAVLQMTLATLRRSANDRSVIDELRISLQTILEQEQLLAKMVRERQTQMENELRTMRKGRRVLTGYSPNHGCSPHARFMNNRT